VSVDTEFIQRSDPFQQFLDLARRLSSDMPLDFWSRAA
jgi:hypothetical protein